MRAAPCSRRFNDRSTRHGTAIAPNKLFVGDSAQDAPQPPLSQSDLVLWHNATVRCDAPIWSLLEVKLTCRERRKRVDLMKMSSRAEEFHLRALPDTYVNLSIHTAPDVRPLPWQSRQWAKSVGLARRSRSNQSRAPLVLRRNRLNLRRAQRMT